MQYLVGKKYVITTHSILLPLQPHLELEALLERDLLFQPTLIFYHFNQA